MSVEYLKELNDAQREAVINYKGPALVIAGAGAGKTRVLIYRIAHLLDKGVPASAILALTFTNKAAAEMKERITELAGPEKARYLWMGTFHSIFARILRINSDRLGYPSAYTIYDSTDSRNLIKTIIKELQLDDKIYKPASVAARISSAKSGLITASEYISNDSVGDRDRMNRVPKIADIYKIYAARCFKAGAMDFDDLLMNTNILFRDFPDVLNEYREKFKYLLVDEYQDTNFSQYIIVKKLSEIHRNLCVVGDDAQSIYSFRGARIENILNFRHDYSDYRLFKLEQNYRSTQNIVNAANCIISKNREQIKKTVFSKKEKGRKISVITSMTDTEEGFRVASDIFDKSLSEQLKWENFAVLYRTNAQSRIFEETLRKRNIPYKIYGGQSFYDRKEIKDILAYFRMIINPDDEEALKRSINYPKRGIGKTTVDRLFEAANRSNVSAWKIISDSDHNSSLLTPGTWKRISAYSILITELQASVTGNNAYQLAMKITSETGIGKELRSGNLPEEISRYENFQELVNAIKVFTESAETNGEPSGLEAYLETVALLTDQDSEGKEERNKVTLMTIHSAKGLEFRHIYIVGLEENLFPSLMAMGNNRDIEEERRLFYVALTRAMEAATLSYAKNRYKWGNLENCKPSRFLNDIDEEFLDYSLSEGTLLIEKRRTSGRVNEKTPVVNQPGRGNLTRLARSHSGGENFSYTEDLSQIKPGIEVSHERFGEGEVIRVEGDAPNTTAVVKFKTAGEKKLLLRFAKLNIK